MINARRVLRRSTFLFLALFAAACSTDSTGPESEDAVFLRVTNERAAAIVVRVVGSDQIPEGDRLTVDFGSLGSGATSDFRKVNESFFVYIDGELLENGSSSRFGIDDTPTNQWTFTVQEGGSWGLQAFFGG